MNNKTSTLLLTIFIGSLVLNWHASSVHAQDAGKVETFDDPALPGWDRTPNAQVIDGALRIQGEGYAIYPAKAVSSSLILRFRLEGDGSLELRYRLSEAGTYILRINIDEIQFVRDAGGQQVVLATAPMSLTLGDWWLLEIIAAGGEQQIFLGPGVELRAIDVNPLPEGGLMLQVFGEALGEFDDLSLGPNEPPKSEEPPTEDLSTSTLEPEETDTLIWIRTGGPPGGLGYDIRYNFDDPDTWYVTDANAGVFISTDNGWTWHPANQGIPAQSGSTGDAIPIFSLTVDPHDPRIVWAGTSVTGHIYRSSDGGFSWEARDNGITIEYDGLTFRGFTVDPRSSDIVYAMAETTNEALGGSWVWGNGTGGVIYKTTDAGLKWTKIWDGGIPSSLTRYLWIDPSNPEVLYVSTGIFDRGAIGEGDPATDPFGGLGILVSTDGGSTWDIQGEENGLRMLYLGSLYMNPENPKILLTAAGHAITGISQYVDYLRLKGETSPSGVYRTDDGGQHWTQVLAPPQDRMLEVFSAVEICTGDPQVAYAASDARVYRSEDAGITWRELPAGLTGWGPPNIKTGFPIDIQCDPRDSNRLFINNYAGGNFLSEDGGNSWVSVSDGYTGAIVRRVAVDPLDAGIVYAAGPNGIWRGLDGGNHWEGLANSTADVRLDLDWSIVAVDPLDTGHLLLAGSPEIFESFDAGLAWHKTKLFDSAGLQLEGDGLAGLLPVSMIAFAPSNPAIVYAGFADGSCVLYHEPCPPSEGGIFVSQDGGGSWMFVRAGISNLGAIFDIGIDPVDPEVVFAAAESGLYRSNDGGSSWGMVGDGPRGARVSAVAVDPQNRDHVLASVDRMGMWESMDGGVSWEMRAAGLEPNAVIHDIVFDPLRPTQVYLSDNASGVYRSQDGGQTWERINQGLSTRAVNGMDISADGLHLYVATQGGGIFRLDLNSEPPVVMGEAATNLSQAEEGPGEPASPTSSGAGPTAEPVPATSGGTAGVGLYIGIVAGLFTLVVLAYVFRRRDRRI